MSDIASLPLPEDSKKFIAEQLNPVLEDLVTSCIVEMPSDTPKFMVEWLRKKHGLEKSSGGGGGAGGAGGVLDALKAGGDDEEEEEEEEESDDELDEIPESMVMKSKGARQSVSAAAYGAWNQKKAFVAPVHAKDDETKAKVRQLLSSSFMFQALDDKDMSTVVDACEPVKLEPKQRVITQGDDGDFMFIIMEGVLDCYKKFPDAEEEKLVKSVEKGDCFGELALLYNCPRAASVESRDACELLKLDSETFSNIVSEAAGKKRERYEGFLKKVPLLADMDNYERSQVADAIKSESHTSGSTIVKEGDPGDKFYIIEEGSAKATKSKGAEEKEVKQYQPGDYFGELALLRNEPRAASVVATADCKVLVLDRRSFKRLLGPLDGILSRAAGEYAK